ncbi:hypothetical protein V8D89_002613 [Ganoderma adspersum]
MQNDNHSPEDLNSWFTYPRVKASQQFNPLDHFSPNSILCELDNFGDLGPLEFEDAILSDMASDGSWGSFDSSTRPSAFNANHTPLLPPSGIYSPPHDMMPSLPPSARSTLLEQYPSHGEDSPDWDWPLTQDGHLTETLPSFLTLPAMSYQQDGSLHYHATATFSSSIRMSDGEWVSSPIPLARDLPPFPEEAALQPPKPHSFSASPSFEKPDTPQLALKYSMSTSSPSGKVNSAVERLRQRKYSSRSQTCDFLPAAIDYGGGYRLDKIRDGVAAIVDQHGVAFPDKKFAQKASFRLEIEGYKPFTLQLNVNTTSGPPTRLRFALRTVDFVERFIEKCRKEGTLFPHELRDLVLVRIDLVSAASVQPVFDIVQAA